MSPPDAVPPVEAVPDEPLDGISATVDPPASSFSAPAPTDLQALLATLVQGQAALTKALADQAAATVSQHSANQALLERIAILESAKEATEGQELQDHRTDLEVEREKYLDVHEYAHLIPPGFKVTPGVQETPKPHLFELYGDRCSDKLQLEKKRGSTEEYRVLYCAAFYLASAIVALNTEFVQHIEEEDPSSTLLKKIVETLTETENWFRRRLAFIRVSTLETETDPLFLEFLRAELYGNADTEALGSEDVAQWARRFHDAKGKQTLAQGAKQAAQRHIKGAVTLPKAKPKSGDDAWKAKGKAKVSHAQDEKGKAAQAGSSGK
mmetsp:Transcript_1441/g.2889  ORF Transcript_1441/g.2889 Transcript_1441/m.2889 type:complete len:324 (+) Transcript_1441:1599-2570(+)